MSQNLIEKLQEIWGDIQQDPTVRKVRRYWNKFKKTETYRKAAEKARLGSKAAKKIVIQAALLCLSSGVTQASTDVKNASSSAEGRSDADTPENVQKLTPVMKLLQANMSAENMEQICCRLLSTDSIYNQICAQRSQTLGEEALRVAKEVQDKIGKDRGRWRKKVLTERWGKSVPVGLHCLRGALEVMTEASKNSDTPEFIDSFVSKIREYNPNSYYGMRQAFAKHRNYKKTTRTHNLMQIINEETAGSPYDICLIAHKSTGNHTGSGYHMVLYYGGTIISFNGECIKDASEYFSSRSKQGELINISKTIRESCREKIVKQTAQQIIAETRDGNPETLNSLLSAYMGDKDIPLQNRMEVSLSLQANAPLVAAFNPLENLKHLRSVRAKMLPPQINTETSAAPTKGSVRGAKLAQVRRAKQSSYGKS